jgi:hypothetical protein
MLGSAVFGLLLLRAGGLEARFDRLTGGNLLRVMRANEAGAAR